MKYRFSSLDQILHSPLFDFSAPCHRPERADHVGKLMELLQLILLMFKM